MILEKRQTDGELSLVGAGAVIEGKFRTEGSIRVDGRLVGEIAANLTLRLVRLVSLKGAWLQRIFPLPARFREISLRQRS
jgi:cytoskeletal protein CcmA (bactofilin family)